MRSSPLAGELCSLSLSCFECDLCFEFRSRDLDLCLCFFSFFRFGSRDPDLERWDLDPECIDLSCLILSLLRDLDRCLGLSLLLDLSLCLSFCLSLLLERSLLLSLSCLLRSLSSSRAKSFLGDRDLLLDGECLLLYGDLDLRRSGDLLGDLDRRLLGDLDLRLGDDRP